MRTHFRMLLSVMSHIIYPAACPLCGKLAVNVCDDCLANCVKPLSPRCICCGEAYPCKSHQHGIPVFSGNIHASSAREMILRLKYSGSPGLGKPMGHALAKKLQIFPDADFLVPIPLHRDSQRKFNQALLISRGIQAEWGVPVKDVLKWNLDNVKQTRKEFSDRKKLAKHAFSLETAQLRGKRVIIIDDVMTTGTTLTRAMDILRGGGAVPVAAVTWTATI